MGRVVFCLHKDHPVVTVTRFNGTNLYVNAELIQTVEGVPDTVITLVNNVKVVVKESPEQVVASIIAYHRKVRNSRLVSELGE
jgi:flagellar protein FlbD